MLYLIWSTINTIIVLYFLYLIIGFMRKGKKIFNPKFKILSIFIMIIGIVQIINAATAEKNLNQIKITNDYDKTENSKVEKIILEDNLTLDINLLVIASIDQNEVIPIECQSFLTGFVNGYEWEFTSIKTNYYKQNERSEFIANGILNWHLFGITVYSQEKTFQGLMN